ncbi:isocitrate lyase/PEP mutase family protein [Streptomyces xinghaiensis]|uniref:isocitrate lyase/PEP mutase family protein n=1 Tax=Streptomyces xinghaiensis TaxID=1038928 RepID=UPI0002EF6A78|nr:isocitrate lyase/phosphoenolpyruvate mutase family protein [Streptomyces xinghaiensis]MZE81451.1 isocitrate lyase/phosphoenolpyruvate mutase family protein [Streptomyces sp. SID5475]
MTATTDTADGTNGAASRAETFRALHHGRAPSAPLVLPGPWDAVSARAFEAAGFPALATPSAGISAALGHPDGGGTPPEEMFAAIGRIVRSVSVPVSADVEDGYGLPPRELVERLLEAGAVGCNLEDSGPADHQLADPRWHADWLAEVRAAAGGALFLNARVDTFLRGIPDLGAAIERGRLYREAGVDCVYPILAPPELLPELAAGIGGPLNAIALPGGPTPRDLGELGATRVTFGGGLQRRIAEEIDGLARELRGG